jgi:hypothetical protein
MLPGEVEGSGVSFFSGVLSGSIVRLLLVAFPFSSPLLPLPCSVVWLEMRPPEAAVKELERG